MEAVDSIPESAKASNGQADSWGSRLAWANQRVSQLGLLQHYQSLAGSGRPLPPLTDVGFSVFSQNDEDGLLLFVFALVGFRSRIAVELCAGDGIECNSANLIVNHGFLGVLYDADAELLERGRRFYAQHVSTRWLPPRLIHTWVTRENVNSLVEDHMFPGVLARDREVDLLSIDLDGNDYWVLEQLACVRPRVVVVEFNAAWGARRAATIPYDPAFLCEPAPVPYAGASLPAFVKLLAGRGYRLVGVERLGFNALFVRNDLAAETLPAVSAEACLQGPIVGICQAGLEGDPRLTAAVTARPWVDV